MCCCNQKKEGCQKPKDLKGKPVDCSQVQIAKCHGEDKKHPCVSSQKDK
jgi:hypothetical protein